MTKAAPAPASVSSSVSTSSSSAPSPTPAPVAAADEPEDYDLDELPGLEGLARRPPVPAVKGNGDPPQIYHDLAFNALPPHAPVRRLAIEIIEHKWFEPFIAVTIAANCFTMAWESPLDPKGTWKDEFIGHCETFFLAVFTCELVLKIISMGFLFHSHSYLRDVWCQLDFVVVTLAWVPIFLPSFAQYSFIRVMRALRPLRTLRFLPGMPVLIGSIFKSIPALGNVSGLCSFIFLIFGIVGEQQQRKHMHAATAHTATTTLPYSLLPALVYYKQARSSLRVPYTINVSTLSRWTTAQTTAIGCCYNSSSSQQAAAAAMAASLVKAAA